MTGHPEQRPAGRESLPHPSQSGLWKEYGFKASVMESCYINSVFEFCYCAFLPLYPAVCRMKSGVPAGLGFQSSVLPSLFPSLTAWPSADRVGPGHGNPAFCTPRPRVFNHLASADRVGPGHGNPGFCTPRPRACTGLRCPLQPQAVEPSFHQAWERP